MKFGVMTQLQMPWLSSADAERDAYGGMPEQAVASEAAGTPRELTVIGRRGGC